MGSNPAPPLPYASLPILLVPDQNQFCSKEGLTEKSFPQETDKQAGNPFSRSPALVERELHLWYAINNTDNFVTVMPSWILTLAANSRIEAGLSSNSRNILDTRSNNHNWTSFQQF